MWAHDIPWDLHHLLILLLKHQSNATKSGDPTGYAVQYDCEGSLWFGAIFSYLWLQHKLCLFSLWSFCICDTFFSFFIGPSWLLWQPLPMTPDLGRVTLHVFPWHWGAHHTAGLLSFPSWVKNKQFSLNHIKFIAWLLRSGTSKCWTLWGDLDRTISFGYLKMLSPL